MATARKAQPATKAAVRPLIPRSGDTKYTGDEPEWRLQPTENRAGHLSKALAWYNYFYGKKEAKEFACNYLDVHDRVKDAKKIRAMPDSQVRMTAGWLCRMSMMGLQLDEHEQIKLDNLITELLTSKEEEVAEVRDETAPARPNIQDRLREKVSECLGELDGQFDEFIAAGAKLNADYKPVSLMRSMNIAPQMISVIKDTWARKLAEFEDVVAGKDADLVRTPLVRYVNEIFRREVRVDVLREIADVVIVDHNLSRHIQLAVVLAGPADIGQQTRILVEQLHDVHA